MATDRTITFAMTDSEMMEEIMNLRAENGRLTAELEEARGLLADLYDLVSDKAQDSIDALFEKMERTTHE